LPSSLISSKVISKAKYLKIPTKHRPSDQFTRNTPCRLPLEAILTTDELARRPLRPPQEAAENHALGMLMLELANSPQSILQKLTDAAIQLCGAGSSGISILEEQNGKKLFRWHAVSGNWSGFLGGTMPREFSPCGTVLDLNKSLLMTEPGRYYVIPDIVTPPMVEILLVPFYVAGVAVGTIWVVTHDKSKQFDAEDERLLRSLGKFASSTYQVLASRVALQVQLAEGKRMEKELRAWKLELESRVVQRTEQLTAAHQQLEVEFAERKRLQSEIADAVEAEQLRFGQELHDGLAQELTGIRMMLETLAGNLIKSSPKGAREAERLGQRLGEATNMTRQLATSFYPVDVEKRGLLVALQELARSTKQSFGISCTVRMNKGAPVQLNDSRAIQLFHIAKEALHNAAKHSQAKKILISLAARGNEWVLTVKDNGVGLHPNTRVGKGIGLRIMQYRARMLGGTLEIRNDNKSGVLVSCTVPISEATKPARKGNRLSTNAAIPTSSTDVRPLGITNSTKPKISPRLHRKRQALIPAGSR
jgi:signal transduction histidine kinase